MTPKKRLFVFSFIISTLTFVGDAVALALLYRDGGFEMTVVIPICAVVAFVGFLFLINGIIEFKVYTLRIKANMESSASAVKQICDLMETLCFKSSSLNSNNEDIFQQVNSIMLIVKEIKPMNDIAAAKFEQDIFCKITAVSSLCDGVIAGNDSADLKKQLSSLEFLLKQRASMSK